MKIQEIINKEIPIWTAQMIDMLGKKGLTVVEREIIELDNTMRGFEHIPETTKTAIVIYLD